MTWHDVSGWVDVHGLDVIGLVILLFAAWPANGIWRLLGRVPWSRSIVGRVLFSKAMMIALVLDLAVLAAVLRLLEVGRPVWFEILRLVMFTGVGVTLWWQRDVFRKIATEPHPSPSREERQHDHPAPPPA